MKTNREKIMAVLDELQITSATTFTWYGKPNGTLPKKVLKAISPSTARQHLVNEIKERLYRSFYGFGFPFADRDDEAGFGYAGDPTFQKSLSMANHGEGCWTSGWSVLAIDEDTIDVARNGLAFEANLATVRSAAGANTISVGDDVEVQTPKEQLGISPGHYLVQSNVDMRKEDPRVRIYWNISPQGAPLLTSEITRRLNDLSVPFRYKVMNDPSRFLRCDVAVLYLRQQDFNHAVRSLTATIHSVRSYLRAGIPAFTRQIAEGVGLAEDPETRESFGLHRSGVLAEAIVSAWEHGLLGAGTSHDIATDYIAEHFGRSGFDLEHAYLNPNSKDVYEITVSDAPSRQSSTTTTVSHGTSPAIDKATLLTTAQAIGRAIADQAIWHNNRCTWVGPDEAANESIGRSVSHYTTLDSTMYLGNAGVALFLAELATITDDDRLKATAIGAARQALLQVDGNHPDFRSGLYCGWTGVASSSAQVATLLGDDSLLDSSFQLIAQRATQSDLDPGEYDVVSGMAGGILGLLAATEFDDVDTCKHVVTRLGERLVDSARSNGMESSWPSLNPTEHNLLGYSHGTSGVAHALIALHSTTGEPQLLDYARQAIQFERRHYDADEQNWPDFRNENHTSKNYMCAWCHGAAGIAISRAVATKHRIDQLVSDELTAALSTTARSVRTWLATDDPASSLCHSGMGNAEILATCNQIVPGCASEYLNLVDEATFRVVARQSQSDLRVQSDSLGPGLMLGLSGIGHYLLRRFNPQVASVLAPATVGRDTTHASAELNIDKLIGCKTAVRGSNLIFEAA